MRKDVSTPMELTQGSDQEVRSDGVESLDSVAAGRKEMVTSRDMGEGQ